MKPTVQTLTVSLVCVFSSWALKLNHRVKQTIGYKKTVLLENHSQCLQRLKIRLVHCSGSFKPHVWSEVYTQEAIVWSTFFSIQSFFLQSSCVNGAGSTTQASPLPAKKQVTPSPVCRFVNVKLCGVEPSQGAKGNEATVLLENPQGENVLDLKQLTQEVAFFP